METMVNVTQPARTSTDCFDVVIIGGGQAGLAVGYHLARRGLRFVILDANERVGDAWRMRWDSLRLFTPARYDGLPGMPFPAPAHSFPTKDEMADYLEAYAARFELPVRTGVKVDGLSREGNRYVLVAGGLRFEAENVVVATGAYHAPRVPVFASELDPNIVQLHSSEYRSPSQLREGDVLVIGAGNSGAEISLEMSRSHRTWLSGRHPGSEPTRAGSTADRLAVPVIWFVFSHVLNVKTPIGRKLRPKMLKMGGIPLARVKPADLLAAGVERVHARTVGTQDGLPVLDDGRVLDVTNVIWCTGYQSDFDWIDLPIFDDDGEPLHERGVVTTEPGLYFVGLFFLSAVTSSLVGGVGRDAAYIVDRITHRTNLEPRKPEGQGVSVTAYLDRGTESPPYTPANVQIEEEDMSTTNPFVPTGAHAAAWGRWHEVLEAEEGGKLLSSKLVELARIEPGDTVLDVAGGYGEPSLTAARAVGPAGRVVCTDISGDMLAVGQERAAAAGLDNVEFIECDAESLDFAPETFDAILSRSGLMLLPDIAGTLKRLRSFLKPGGRLAASVWGLLPTFQLAAAMPVVFEELAVPPPTFDGPGPFALSDPDQLAALLESAGFRDVETGTLTVLYETDTPEQFTQFALDVAPPFLLELVDSQPPEIRQRVWDRAVEAYSKFQGPDGRVRTENQAIWVAGTA